MGTLGTVVLVTAAAGVGGTGLGGGAACLLRRRSDRMVSLMLSFAAGAMLYVVFAELLPEAAELWQSRLPALAAVLGMIVGMAITLGQG